MAEIAPPGRSSRPLLGVLFMCAACALFPIMNGIVKLLAATYDPLQIVWFRVTMHLFLVALVFMPRMGLGLFRTRRIGSQFVNSVMMLLSTLFFFSAVKYVGVADAISFSFVALLALVFLVWLIIGDRITSRRSSWWGYWRAGGDPPGSAVTSGPRSRAGQRSATPSIRSSSAAWRGGSSGDLDFLQRPAGRHPDVDTGAFACDPRSWLDCALLSLGALGGLGHTASPGR
jgi:hypothetical protein